MPNLDVLCKEYYNLMDSTDGRRSITQTNMEINLSKVKISVRGSPRWNSQRPSRTQESAQKVTVQRYDTQRDAFGTLSTSKEFKWKTEVTIDSEVIKGLNSQMKLPLDPTLKGELGDSVSIDVSKAHSVTEPTVPIDIHTGQKFEGGASANVAHVSSERLDYRGEFECRAVLKGKVIFQLPNGNSETKLAVVCQELISSGKREYLQGLRVEQDGGVVFPLKGTVIFRGDNESIEWK